MKLLIILLTIIIPLCSYSYEAKDAPVSVNQSSIYNIIATIDIDVSEVTFPYIIDITAPTEEIIGISGPSRPGIKTWKVENGRLKITLYPIDFDSVNEGQISYIEIGTNPLRHYAIQIDAY